MPSKIRIGNEWKPLVELPQERFYYAMVGIGSNRIAIVGGYDGKSKDCVDTYNLESKEWATFKMKEHREDCAAVAIDEKLFIFGGLRAYDCLSSCEVHDLSDPSQDESHYLPSMSEAKYGCGAVVYENTNVVVLGGKGRLQQIATIEMFDTINHRLNRKRLFRRRMNKKWTKLPSMPK